MRKHSSFFGFLLFFIGQFLVFFALRRGHSFADSKWTLALAEGILVLFIAFWYLAFRPVPVKAKKRVEPQRFDEGHSMAIPQKEIPPILPSEDQKKALEDAERRLKEAEIFSQGRIKELEEEKSLLKKELSHKEEVIKKSKEAVPGYCQIIQELVQEVEKMVSQMDEERRRHALEIRTLLKINGKKELSQRKIKEKKRETSPLSSLLLFLLQCHKGLHDEKNGWPEGNLRELLRRRFFEEVKRLHDVPFAILSLENSSDHFLSPALPESISLIALQGMLEERREKCLSLSQFEPCHCSLSSAAPSSSWIVFRSHWDHLNDLFILVPSSASQVSNVPLFNGG
jgi:hypothetical protein